MTRLKNRDFTIFEYGDRTFSRRIYDLDSFFISRYYAIKERPIIYAWNIRVKK